MVQPKASESMTKLVTLLGKKADLSYEEFLEHWMTEHVPLARQLPGLRGYSTVVPDDPEESAYDGVALLEFEDPESLSTAFDSEEGEQTVADLDNFVEDVVRVVGNETVQVEP